MSPFAKGIGPAFLLILILSPAQASLTLCNRTSYVVYAATAAVSPSGIDVNGWTRVVPGGCAAVIQGDLTAPAYYVSARSSRAHSGPPRAWNGAVSLCVKDRDFHFHFALGLIRCTDADSYSAGFAPLQTRHKRSWTTTLREVPDFPSMAAAENAGLKRLLGDIGFQNLRDDKAAEAALAQFRKRMRLPETADRQALFSALETEAMKTAVPLGYTICNDTAKPVYAALAQQKGSVFASRGWWTVAGGTCAPIVTDSIAGTAVWLRVEGGGGAPLVSGNAKFCVTNIEFEVQGREHCAQRGLTEAGFAETNLGRKPGYTAHVTANGLK